MTQVKNYVDLKNARTELDKLIEEAEAEEKAKEAEEQEIISTAPYSEAILLCNAIKEALYNPDSFQLHSVKYVSESIYNYYYVDYSGQNKMGGNTRSEYIGQFSSSGYLRSTIQKDHADWYSFNKKFYNNTTELDVDFILKYVK